MAGLRRLGWGVVGLLGAWLCARMAIAGSWSVALCTALVWAGTMAIYLSPKTRASRYLLPGLAGFGCFVVLPLVYTVFIAFTNYGGGHLLDRERVDAWFAQEERIPSPERFNFRVWEMEETGKGGDTITVYRIQATYASPEDDPGTDPRKLSPLQVRPGDTGRRLLLSPWFPAEVAASGRPIPLNGLNTVGPSGKCLDLRGVVAVRPWLLKARFTVPGVEGRCRAVTLRELAPRAPLWERGGDDPDVLVNAENGQTLRADERRGNYVDVATGEAVGPGWRVAVGFDNYCELFGNPAVRGPFLSIFAWNVAFALLSVLVTFAVGVLLASLLQWKDLRGRAIYRTLLILPYAIPAFIPILVFKGLFNEGFGEINLALTHLFGVAPHWFTNPWLARLMILIVNTWLGYPYMMIICSGMLQAVPGDLYEASAMDGAGPWRNFIHVTLPQIVPPLFPLLVASFAFNFNNFSLIYLLTGGKPDIVGSATVAGSTDLLVSYTFRMAFKDSAVRYGFASAIATILFLLVAGLAVIQLRASRKKPARG